MARSNEASSPCLLLNGNVFRRYGRRIMIMNKDLRARLKGQKRGEACRGGRLICRIFLGLVKGGGSVGFPRTPPSHACVEEQFIRARTCFPHRKRDFHTSFMHVLRAQMFLRLMVCMSYGAPIFEREHHVSPAAVNNSSDADSEETSFLPHPLV